MSETSNPTTGTLKERISEDIKTAMKARDKIRLETIRSIKKVIIEKETEVRPKGQDQLTPEQELELLGQTIQKLVEEKGHCSVNAICTHNSRRSQLAEFMMRISAHHFKIENIHFFSGGTESTAFNHRMVRALEDFDFEFIFKNF